MSKRKIFGKIFGIALVLVMIGAIFNRTALAVPSLAVKNSGAYYSKKVNFKGIKKQKAKS